MLLLNGFVKSRVSKLSSSPRRINVDFLFANLLDEWFMWSSSDIKTILWAKPSSFWWELRVDMNAVVARRALASPTFPVGSGGTESFRAFFFWSVSFNMDERFFGLFLFIDDYASWVSKSGGSSSELPTDHWKPLSSASSSREATAPRWSRSLPIGLWPKLSCCCFVLFLCVYNYPSFAYSCCDSNMLFWFITLADTILLSPGLPVKAVGKFKLWTALDLSISILLVYSSFYMISLCVRLPSCSVTPRVLSVGTLALKLLVLILVYFILI